MTKPSKNFESVDAQSVSGIADHIVTTTAELESAFNNLSAGDTVWIAKTATPYRPTQWLDIDVSGVTVVGQSMFAGDGQALVKPADGSDVGGIRIGNSSAVSGVTVRCFGFDGNQATMTDTVKRLHAVTVDDAQDILVDQIFATQTHPYQEHNSGGSGVSVRRNASDVVVQNCYGNDVGDRFIQVAGQRITVENIFERNGFDRTVSLDVEHPDGNKTGADGVVINNVHGHDNLEGSVIGLGAASTFTNTEAYGNYTISNIVATGTHRSAVAIQANAQDVEVFTITNVVGTGGSRDGIRTRELDTGAMRRGTISNCYLLNYGRRGLWLQGGSLQISNVVVNNPATEGVELGTGGGIDMSNVEITSAGNNGILNNSTGTFVSTGIRVDQSGDDGIVIPSTGIPQIYYGVTVTRSNQNASGSVDINVTGGAEHQVWGDFDTVSDSGTRTVLNGAGSNAGDPSSAGDWNGNGRRGVAVEDTSNAGDVYRWLPSASQWVGVRDNINPKIIGGQIVWGGHSDFSTAQAALDFANNNGYAEIWFPQGASYGSISPYSNQRVYGVGNFRGNGPTFNGGSTAHGIDIAANCTVENVRAETTGGGFNAVNITGGEPTLKDVMVSGSDNHAFYINTTYVQLTGCYTFIGQVAGDGVLLDSSSANCVVDSNRRMGTITDNGSTNVVGDNS